MIRDFLNIIDRSINYFATIGISDIIDILIMTWIIYELIMVIIRTNSANFAKAFILFFFALFISEFFQLTMINYFLRKAVELGIITLIVLFQPELRRLLERVGSKFSSNTPVSEFSVESAVQQVVLACKEMSEAKTGALIIFERALKLNDIIESGTKLCCDVNSELLKNLFYDKAPLHDGAVLIRGGKIVAAGCVLPLTKTSISKDLGMRHRAGIGISEQSDAVVVIVSEETGTISCAIGGSLKRHLSYKALNQLLNKELSADDIENNSNKKFHDFIKDAFLYMIRPPKKEENNIDEETIQK